jgi:hypothetical protein
MTKKDLIEYLKGGLKRGFPLEELKQNLLARGFFDYDINEAIIELNSMKEEIKKPKRTFSFFSPKFILYSIFGFFILFIFTIFFILKSSASIVILGKDLSEGLSVDMMHNKIEIEMDDGKKEKIELEIVLDDSIKINFGKQNTVLEIGKEKEIDLDGDGLNDVTIKLESIFEDIPKLYFKKLVRAQERLNDSDLNVTKLEDKVIEVENKIVMNKTIAEENEAGVENLTIVVNDSNENLFNDTLNETIREIVEEETEHLKFIYDKDEVQTGEILDISYQVSGLSENAKLLLYRYKKDEDRKFFGISEEYMNSISTIGLRPFVDGDGFFETDFFYVAGIYIYEVELYYCSEHNSCDSDYSVSEVVEDFSDLKPDEKIYKEIVVSGETIEY